jgi:hypothetical protein
MVSLDLLFVIAPFNFVIRYSYQLLSQAPKKNAKGPAEETSDGDTLDDKLEDKDELVDESKEDQFSA